jgi:Zn-dependent M28 family amino/carboxypeptidase
MKFLSILFVAVCLNMACKNEPGPYPSMSNQRAVINKKKYVQPIRILDSSAIVTDLKFLASDSCAGRAPGTKGHELALQRIISRIRSSGVDSFDNSLVNAFSKYFHNTPVIASNVIGYVKGNAEPDSFIVISAHYDHLGKIGDSIYYGASDNASGVACVLAMASYFNKHPQRCSLVFALFDMEEEGEKGAFRFTEQLPSHMSLKKIKLNVNVDMIVRNDDHELFACGVYHYPFLKYLVDETQTLTNTKLLMGHDHGKGREDWTNLSDHYPFHRNHIPFIYLGTEDHVDYHRPSDTWNKIDLSDYIENCNLIATMVTKIK